MTKHSNAVYWIISGVGAVVLILALLVAAVLMLGDRPTQVSQQLPPTLPPMEPDAPSVRQPVRIGDVTVQVESASVGLVDVDSLGRLGKSENSFLQIRLTIKNESPTRKIQYSGWGTVPEFARNRNAASMRDNFGNAHMMPRWGFGLKVAEQIQSKSLFPEATTQDLLVFDEPVKRAEYLNLELPAAAVGESGVFRFRIDKSVWQIGE